MTDFEKATKAYWEAYRRHETMCRATDSVAIGREPTEDELAEFARAEAAHDEATAMVQFLRPSTLAELEAKLAVAVNETYTERTWFARLRDDVAAMKHEHVE